MIDKQDRRVPRTSAFLLARLSMPLRTFLVTALLGLLLSCTESENPSDYLAEGREYLSQGKLKAALISLKNAARAAPDNGEIRAELGEVYLQLNNTGAGLKELVRARELGLTSNEINLKIAEAYLDSEQLELAIEEIDKVGDDTPAWVALQAGVDYQSGRYEEAARLYENILAGDENNRDALHGLILANLQLNELEKARDLITDAVSRFPDNLELWIAKGDLHARERDYHKCRDAFSRSLELVPENPRALTGRATCYASLGEFALAQTDLDKLEGDHKLHPSVLYLKSVIAFNQRNYQAAVTLLSTILQGKPNDKDANQLLAMVYFRQGNYPLADEHLSILLSLEPQNQEYRNARANIQLHMGQRKTEFGDIESFDFENNDNPGLLMLLGETLIKHGELEKGQRALELAQKHLENDISLKVKLAYGKILNGQLDEGTRELEQLWQDNKINSVGFFLALAYSLGGQQAESLDITEDLLSTATYPEAFLNLRAQVYLRFGKIAEAKSDLQEALEKSPGFTPAKLNLAQALMLDGTPAEAKKILTEVLGQSPGNLQAHLKLASIALADEDLEQAVRLWKNAAEKNPQAVRPRVALAKYYRREGDMSNAKVYAEQAYQVGSYLSEAQFEYALSLLNEDRTREAVEPLTALVKRNPSAVEPLKFLKSAHEEIGTRESFVKLLEELISDSPERIYERSILANRYIADRRYKEAIALAQEISNHDDSSILGLNLLGTIHHQQGNTKQAENYFRQSHDANPSSATVLKLAQTLPDADKLGLLNDWIETNPDDIPVHVLLASKAETNKDYELAETHYRKVLNLQPDHLLALNNLAWIYHLNGNDKALEYAEKAYGLNSEVPEIANTLGSILLKQNTNERAVELLERAVEQAPNNPAFRYQLALGLSKIGDNGEAVEQLQQALRGNIDFPGRKDAEYLYERLKP